MTNSLKMFINHFGDHHSATLDGQNSNTSFTGELYIEFSFSF